MSEYGAFSDEFYVNMNLATEMELTTSRDSVMHYFEQIRRHFPGMSNFYSREAGEYVLEEEKVDDHYRWASIETKRVNSGVLNPISYDNAIEQHRTILERVPYDLSVTPLDCESLSVMVGFDFVCQGNHNELLADVLGLPTKLERFAEDPNAKLLNYEPSIHFALDKECRTQGRISFESRTNAFQVRTEDFGEDSISVYVTLRRYDSLGAKESFASEFDRLAALCRDLIDEHVVTGILRPLQEAISLR